MKRKTISKEVTIKGVGIHTGEMCTMLLRPNDGGIYFRRLDLPGSAPIPARLENVSSTLRGTNLMEGAAEIHTGEHVLSAVNALGITDLIIEMDGPEPPITDGSALPFINALKEAGIKELPGERAVLNIDKKIEMRSDKVYYCAEPADKLTFSFLFLHPHPLVSRLEYTFEFNEENFIKEIAPARTFGFEEEFEFLKKHGLAKGANIDNAVLITKDGFSVPLRFEGEMVRHKILDMVGDFALIAKALGPMKIYSEFGGHKFNVEFGKLLLKEGK